MMRNESTDQWMYGAELRLDSLLQGVNGYVPLMSHVSFLGGTCGGTTHGHRMKQMAEVALSHPCTVTHSRIIVAQYWNLDDEVTYPAWLELN